jgi:hypothetical protein
LVWAWAAERRWTHHDGDRSVTYDVPAILAALERFDPDHRNTPGRVLTRLLDEHHRPHTAIGNQPLVTRWIHFPGQST